MTNFKEYLSFGILGAALLGVIIVSSYYMTQDNEEQENIYGWQLWYKKFILPVQTISIVAIVSIMTILALLGYGSKNKLTIVLVCLPAILCGWYIRKYIIKSE